MGPTALLRHKFLCIASVSLAKHHYSHLSSEWFIPEYTQHGDLDVMCLYDNVVVDLQR